MKLIKTIFKYFLRFIAVVILIYILKIGLLFSDLHPFKLSDNFYLIGNGSEDYTIQKGFFGKTVVSNLTSRCRWVITPSSIYGYTGDNQGRYFYLNKAAFETNYFVNFSSFRKHLSSNGHKKYTESESEGLVHLKYGNGRDRKYK